MAGNLFNGNTATNTPSKRSNQKKDRKGSRQQNTILDDLSDVASITTTSTCAYDNASFTDPCIVNDISLKQLYSPHSNRRATPKQQRRQAYHGSLPNNLDTDDDVVDGVLNQKKGKYFIKRKCMSSNLQTTSYG